MAYEPTNWNCGDVVTAEKLNKLENAVEELSENSGGGTVEVIKLGTASGGGNILANFANQVASASQQWGISGGGSFENGKTLGEVLDGKTIINIFAEIESTDSTRQRIEGISIYLESTANETLLNQQFDENLKSKTSFVFHAVGFGDTPPNGKTINIYAICI